MRPHKTQCTNATMSIQRDTKCIAAAVVAADVFRLPSTPLKCKRRNTLRSCACNQICMSLIFAPLFVVLLILFYLFFFIITLVVVSSEHDIDVCSPPTRHSDAPNNMKTKKNCTHKQKKASRAREKRRAFERTDGRRSGMWTIRYQVRRI